MKTPHLFRAACLRWPLLLAAAALATLSGCAPMATGGSSVLPSFSNGFSFSPSVNVARNMKGRSVNDAIAALGEPSRTKAVGNGVMQLEWTDYQTAPYTEWVNTGSSQQVVGMIPGSRNSAPTPVMQTTNYGYMQNRTKVYECAVIMRMRDSVIIESTVEGNVCPEFIGALRTWAAEKEAKDYMN
ncbi:hypothetical protein ACILG0_12155 [Pseudomonadota bacterium AL_CKDN230030165-1A_HGKHYDSX7]